MTANVIERQPQMQYEKYTIDTDRLTQRFQQKNMEHRQQMKRADGIP